MKTILFPTDFSERADSALTQAIDFAEKLAAKIIIYHVYHRPPNNEAGSAHVPMSLSSMEKKIDAVFQRMYAEHDHLKTIEHEFKRELGISIERIIGFSKNEHVDLIIMATKGARGFGELWGSKTAQIVEQVDVPVLVIPDNTKLDMSKMALLCDYSAEADYHTLDFLLEIAELLKLDTDVLTLNRDEKIMTHEEKSYRQLVRKKLESVPVDFHIAFHSNIEHGVMAYSIANDIGLIAMVPKNYQFIEHLFHESLTQKMTFHSSIPLLVLK
jgi:nucleotide-binding universal stress UspA family protein